MTDTNTHHLVTMNVNEQPRIEAVEVRQTLLETLRNDLELTGAKAGCEMGNCGACTVILDGKAVYSCLVLGVECDGASVATIEGIADGGDLEQIQKSVVECDGLQCGFCTPGQVMSLVALKRAEKGTTTMEQIQTAVSGNLCRCGAYNHICDAAADAFGVER